MANTTHYSQEQVAHALAALETYGGNAKLVSKLLGIPRTTLRQWAGRAKSDTAHPQRLHPNERIAEKYGAVADRALDEAGTPVKIGKAGFRDLMMGAQIATQMQQLLLGRPTSRSEHMSVTLVASGELQSLGGSVLAAIAEPKDAA